MYEYIVFYIDGATFEQDYLNPDEIPISFIHISF